MGDIGQWVFFRIIFLYLDDKVAVMRDNMLSGFMQWALSFLIMLVTAWIAFQGWLIVTGRSREPMMALVTNALRIGLVSMLGMAFSYRSDYLGTLLSDTLPRSAMGVVTGEEDDPADKIDRNFALMGATFAVMNAFAASSGGRDDLLGQVRQATTMSAVGTAGPAVIGGALLLAYKVALALFVGFGPLFILCLIFPSTRQLFQVALLRNRHGVLTRSTEFHGRRGDRTGGQGRRGDAGQVPAVDPRRWRRRRPERDRDVDGPAGRRGSGRTGRRRARGDARPAQSG